MTKCDIYVIVITKSKLNSNKINKYLGSFIWVEAHCILNICRSDRIILVMTLKDIIDDRIGLGTYQLKTFIVLSLIGTNDGV